MARILRLSLGDGEMKKINLAGRRFGKLTVYKESGRSRSGKVMWSCACDCGGRVKVASGHLKSGNTTSCGCVKKAALRRGNQVKNIKGMRFGMLIVVSKGETNSHGQATWECLCDCGKTTTVVGSSIISGHTASCGCLKKDLSKQSHKKWISMAEMRSSPITRKSVWSRRIPVCDHPEIGRDSVVSVR